MPVKLLGTHGKIVAAVRGVVTVTAITPAFPSGICRHNKGTPSAAKPESQKPPQQQKPGHQNSLQPRTPVQSTDMPTKTLFSTWSKCGGNIQRVGAYAPMTIDRAILNPNILKTNKKTIIRTPCPSEAVQSPDAPTKKLFSSCVATMRG